MKNLIFDWDGTLSDSLPKVFIASMNVFEKLGLKKLSLEEFKREFRAPYIAFYRKFTQASKTKIDSLYLQEISLLKRSKLFPGIKELLEFLNKKRKKLAILSSYPQEKLREEVEYYGLQEFFVEVIGSVHSKVRALTLLMERNRFLASSTAYIGDMLYDVKAGKIAKVTTIALSWGYQSRNTLLLAKPNFIFSDLREIKKIIS